MEIITNQYQYLSVTLSKIKENIFSPLLMQFLKLKDPSQLYNSLQAYEGVQFVENALARLQIKLEFHPQDLHNIPPAGGFIAVANHSYGALDGLILTKLFAQTRPGFKMMANHLLMQISNMQNLFVSVSPFKEQQRDTIISLEEALSQLQNDRPLGVFPAGEQPGFNLGSSPVDSEWSSSLERLIHKAKVPVVPVYIAGDISSSLNVLGYLDPLLHKTQLPAELIGKKGKTIKVHIGKPIAYNKLQDFPEKQLLQYISAKTYVLSSAHEVKQTKLLEQLEKYTVPKAVIAETDKRLILKELSLLSDSAKLFVHENLEVYVATQEQAPHIVQELGRLRELSLRAVGEGTNKPLDLDEYDAYYQHLFLYDRNARLIVGAYRLGKGKAIHKKYGKEGFYLHSVFKIKGKFVPTLKASVEIGTPFIREGYKSQQLPLVLLWKGIATYLENRPAYRYLIGSIDISHIFSTASKMQLVDLITSHFYDLHLAKYVQTRKKFRYRLCREYYDGVLNQQKPMSDSLEKLMLYIDPKHTSLALLIKKYLKLHTRVIGFNMNPKHSNSLNGLIVMDAVALPAIVTKVLQQHIAKPAITNTAFSVE